MENLRDNLVIQKGKEEGFQNKHVSREKKKKQ
jgi:hypothetical protein